MPNRASLVLAALVALLLSTTLFAQTTYYFKGDPADQANKVANDPASGTIGTATFDTSPPTGTAPITQTGSPFSNANFVANRLSIYWSCSFSCYDSCALDLKLYWSTLTS